LYQGRFKSFPVQADDHLYAVLRYVERNALRAGLVQRAQDWRWSSARAHLRGRDDGLTALAPIRARFPRFAVGFGAAAAASALFHLVVYGVPLPYISYVLNVRSPNIRVPDIVSLKPQLILPGLLFDRASGYAAFAPWVFIGAIGSAPLLSRARSAALASLTIVAATIAAVSVISEWRGGWAPPGRYLAEVIPVWTPFVAAGLVAASSRLARYAASVAFAWSAFMALLFAGMPPVAYDDRVAEWFARFLPVHPLAFLPLVATDDLVTTLARSLILAGFVVGIAAFAARRPGIMARWTPSSPRTS
jgi:hypothetical protein